MKLYIHYNQKNHRGPGKVVQNLLKGFEKLGVEIVKKPGKADYYGCLQHPGSIVHYLPKETLIGPNIFVLPNEASVLVHQMNNFIVPSQWIKQKYEHFSEMKDKNINIWPVGIDTDEWTPQNTNKDLDCFIYFKNRETSNYWFVKDVLCKNKNLRTETISYGNYREEELKDVCERSKFAILLTDTESQGIAYMQMLSMNIPCFVINKNIWNYQNQFGTYKFSGTSVPYFDEQCGIISNSKLKNSKKIIYDFDMFLQNLKSYSPRDYILNNHTLTHSAEKYIKILEKSTNFL